MLQQKTLLAKENLFSLRLVFMLIANLYCAWISIINMAALVAQVVWVLELVGFIVLFYRVITSY